MSQQPRINNGILVGGTVRIGGNLITTQNSGNITTTTYGGSNYTGAINSGNKGTTITGSSYTDSSVHNSNNNISGNINSGNTNSTFNSNNNSNNTNSGNTNSGNTTTTITNTNSNNRVLPTQYQMDIPVTKLDDMESAILARGFHVKPEKKRSDKERLIRGKSYLLPPTFLMDAQERSAAVCFIDTDNGCGTGFMISDRLMMTAQHVIPDAKAAATAKVTFGYETDLPPGRRANYVYPKTSWSLEPDVFYIEHEGIDVAVCAISRAFQEQKQEQEFKPIALKRCPTIAEVDSFNIIQHPSGGPKRFALRGWQMKSAEKGLLRYDTDTMPGSSGSPVFNDFWEIVAVHNSSAQDENANQGTYIDVVIDWMLQQKLTNNEAKGLVDALKLEPKPKK